MENKSVQDILDVDVEAIAERGKSVQKKKKRVLRACGIILGIVLLGVSAWPIKNWYIQKKNQQIAENNINIVENAIENIATEYPERISSTLYAKELYNALDDTLKACVSNAQELEAMETDIIFTVVLHIMSESEHGMKIGDYTAVRNIAERLSFDTFTRLNAVMPQILFEEITLDECTFEEVLAQYSKINSVIETARILAEETYYPEAYYKVIDFFELLLKFSNGDVQQQEVLDKKGSIEKLFQENSE